MRAPIRLLWLGLICMSSLLYLGVRPLRQFVTQFGCSGRKKRKLVKDRSHIEAYKLPVLVRGINKLGSCRAHWPRARMT